MRAGLATADAATSTEIIAKLHLAEAQLDAMLLQYKASSAAAEAALARYRELGDALGIAEAQRLAGRAFVFLGRIPEGEERLTEALASAAALGARNLTARVLEGLAIARHFSGDVAGARAPYAEALAIFESDGAERLAAAVAANLTEAEFRGGDVLRALGLADDTLARHRAHNNTGGIVVTLYNMSAYLIALDRCDEAKAHAREALALARDLQLEVILAMTLQHLAAVAALRFDPNDEPGCDDRMRAARLLGYVDARLTALEASREYTEQQEHDRMLAALRGALGEDELTKLKDEGRAWNEEQAVSEAMLI